MMSRDYTGKALFTLFLYCCGYLPGLFANLLLLSEASGDKERYGEAPGWGCLVSLLIFVGIGPVAALAFVYIGLHYLY